MLANSLTALRLILVLPFFGALRVLDFDWGAVAAFCLALAIASDLLDGPAARSRGTASPSGQLFDHVTDCIFVTAGLAASAVRGVVPALLPVLVAASFAQYWIDSAYLERSPALRMSALGRINGILYFAPLVGDVLAELGLAPLRPAATALAWALVLSTLLSMADRAQFLRR